MRNSNHRTLSRRRKSGEVITLQGSPDTAGEVISFPRDTMEQSQRKEAKSGTHEEETVIFQRRVYGSSMLTMGRRRGHRMPREALED